MEHFGSIALLHPRSLKVRLLWIVVCLCMDWLVDRQHIFITFTMCTFSSNTTSLPPRPVVHRVDHTVRSCPCRYHVISHALESSRASLAADKCWGSISTQPTPTSRISTPTPTRFALLIVGVRHTRSAMSDKSPQSNQFVCQYCQRNFKRLEHVQRHERTHTKEAPYVSDCPMLVYEDESD